MFRLLAFLFAALALHAQSIRYEVPKTAWDKNLGSHRVVVRVGAPAEAVRANLEWRRRDPQPEKHGVVVTDAAGKRVENALATLVTNDAGEVIFQAAAAGEYAVYFLPGNPGGGSFPEAKYLGPQDTGAADWKGKLGDVKKLPEAKAIRWEARTEHDRFNEMEIIATKSEKDAWLAAHPGDVHVFLESRERPVRMFDQVPEIWLKREKPPEFVARPGEVFMFQVCVWAAREQSLKRSVLSGELASLKAESSLSVSIKQVGIYSLFPYTTGPQAHGTIQPRWMYVEVPSDVAAGIFPGTILLRFDLENGTAPLSISIPFSLKVEGELLADGGDSEPWKHTKLRWLDSRIGATAPQSSSSASSSRQRIRVVPHDEPSRTGASAPRPAAPVQINPQVPRPSDPPQTQPAQSRQRIKVVVPPGAGATPQLGDEKTVPRTEGLPPPNAPAEPHPAQSRGPAKIIERDGTVRYLNKEPLPYIPRPEWVPTPQLSERKNIYLKGRKATIGNNGLPEKILSLFNQSVTEERGGVTSILAAPMRFVATRDDGTEVEFSTTETLKENHSWRWAAKLTAEGVGEMRVTGTVDSEGYLDLRCAFTPTSASIRDIRLEIPRTADTCNYSTGLGYYGGAAQLPVDWKWDVKKHQDAHWMGDVNAGLRVRLTGQNYVRPMINIHYPRQPLNLPPSWGTGGIKIERKDEKTVLFTAYSGPRTLEPGKPLHFNFDLSITPFKPLNTAAQWKDRYFHIGGVQDPAKVKASGANIINIHQGNALNPYINYPFLTADKLREYADKVHALGMRVKYYYTIRELSNWTPEIFALRSFGSELLAPGRGGTRRGPCVAGGASRRQLLGRLV